MKMQSIIPQKPKKWAQMPLYKKVAIYQKHLGAFHAPFVDKLVAKKIVKAICGDPIHVAPVVRILSSPDDLRIEDLQASSNRIIKATHASKWNIAIESGISDLKKIIQQLHQWNRTYSPGIEKQYAYIQPRFFIEERIVDNYADHFATVGIREKDAIVYMCRCIYGDVVSISARLGELRNDYDREWNVIGGFQLPFIQKPQPDRLATLIWAAEKLSAPFEFVRMDFYLSADEKIYFSEFTFSPSCGLPTLPGDLEYTLSKKWV